MADALGLITNSTLLSLDTVVLIALSTGKAKKTEQQKRPEETEVETAACPLFIHN